MGFRVKLCKIQILFIIICNYFCNLQARCYYLLIAYSGNNIDYHQRNSSSKIYTQFHCLFINNDGTPTFHLRSVLYN